MKALLIAVALSLATSTAFAAGKDEKGEPSEKQKAHQERTKDCNAKAADKKGDDRKKFMTACLKGDADAKSNPQEARMASCNKEASDKNLKGDQRKTFMSSCVKGGSKTAQ